MAISPISSLQQSFSGGVAQIQQQQAQRNADQAQAQARSLQAAARSAQTLANRAQEDARSLNVQATQAQGEASNAKQSVSALKSLSDSGLKLNDLRQQIGEILNPTSVPVAASDVAASTTVALSPVINSLGQQTGTLVNVTA